MLQIVASLTDNTRSVNYDRNTFIIQATDHLPSLLCQPGVLYKDPTVWLSGATPPTISLTMHSLNSEPFKKNLKNLFSDSIDGVVGIGLKTVRTSWAKCYKTFYGRNLRMYVLS